MIRAFALYLGFLLVFAAPLRGENGETLPGWAASLPAGAAKVVSAKNAEVRVSEEPLKNPDNLQLEKPLVLKTGSEGTLSLVFSNGLSLNLAPESEVLVKAFRQKPFHSSAKDLRYEPSRSYLHLFLKKGRATFAHRVRQPTSLLLVDTPLGTFESRCRQFTLVAEPNKVQAAVLDQSVVYHPDGFEARRREFIQAGQSATVTRGSQSEIIPLNYTNLGEVETTSLRHLIEQAAFDRQRVFFDTGNPEEAQTWRIQPYRVMNMNHFLKVPALSYWR